MKVGRQKLTNPDASLPHCHCPTVAIGSQGEVFLSWYAYPEKETCGGTLMFVSKPRGQQLFGQARRILPEMTKSLGNPVLFVDAFGTLHLLFVQLRGHYWDSAVLYASKSEDGGCRWSQAELVRAPEGMMVRYAPIVRSNGYLLLPAYDEKENRTVILTADPEGSGWFPVTHFEEKNSIQGSIVRHSENELTMLLRPCGDLRCNLRSLSSDDGRSWSSPIRTTLPNPLSGVSSFGVGDKLCAVYNHTTEHRRYPLSLAWSTNRGTTWSDPVHLDESQHEVSYPYFVVDDKDVVHGTYTDGRIAIQYVFFDGEELG